MTPDDIKAMRERAAAVRDDDWDRITEDTGHEMAADVDSLASEVERLHALLLRADIAGDRMRGEVSRLRPLAEHAASIVDELKRSELPDSGLGGPWGEILYDLAEAYRDGKEGGRG